MDALVVHDEWLTSVRQLTVTPNVPVPELKPGQVLVKVMAAGANFFDILMVQGKYQIKPPRPFTPGCEFAGFIVKTHPTVCHLAIGARVLGSATWGAYADYIAVSAENVIPIPTPLTFEQACGISITYPTSYVGLVDRGRIEAGSIVLVHAAAGGVGLAAVQLAKVMRATVIATVGSKEKMAVVKKAGADHVVNYREPDWPVQVRKLTPKGQGVDIVYDPVGLVDPSLKCTAWNGRIVVVGFAAGSIEKVAMNRILLKNVSLVGLHWGAYLKNQPKRVPEVWSALLPLLEQQQLMPHVYPQIFDGLGQVADALEAIASRKSYGKVVVRVAELNAAKL